jgi:hypothetical protein
MACRDEPRSQLIRPVEQPAELQVLIAHDARVGRPAGFIFIREILNDFRLKLFGLIDEVVRDPQLVANRSGIGDGLGATAFVLGSGDAVLRPKLERDAHDVKALLEQKGSGSGRIDSAAHADDHSCFILHSNRQPSRENRPCKTSFDDKQIRSNGSSALN